MKNYYDNFTVKSLFNDNTLKSLIMYLMKSVDYTLNDNQKEVIFKDKFIIQDTPNKLYRRICDVGMSDRFTLFSPPKRTPIPEVLTFKSLVIDTEQLNAYNSSIGSMINGFSEYCNKSIIHLTPYIKTDMSFSDQTEFQYIIIRDTLAYTFFKQKSQWLLPIIKIIAKIYSITLSKSIVTMYNLNIQEQAILNSIFLYYFLTLCLGSSESAKSMMLKMNSYFYIPDAMQLEKMYIIIEDTLNKSEFDSLFDIFVVVPKLLPQRVTLNYPILVNKNKKLHNDIMTSTVAIEYPPYFVETLIESISGVKNGLSFVIKNLLQPKEKEELIRYFSTNPSFLNNIK